MLQISIREYPLRRADPFAPIEPHFPARYAVEAEWAAAHKSGMRTVILDSAPRQSWLQTDALADRDKGLANSLLQFVFAVHNELMVDGQSQAVGQLLIMQDGAATGRAANNGNVPTGTGLSQAFRKLLVISQ